MHAYRSDPKALARPWIDSPFLESQLAAAPLGEAERSAVRSFARDGLWIVEETVADDALRARIAQELGGRYTDSATGYSGGGRILDAWRANEAVSALACAPRILEILELLYQRPAIPFQTLNFERGSEQRAHSDVIHFDSVPYGFLCGVWVALEDVDASAGPLFYYPGSHRLPRFDLHDIGLPTGFRHYRGYEDFVEALLAESGLERRELLLRRGQAAVWAANLFHGGAAIRDAARTRLSQVTHYYFPGCMYFQPMGSDLAVGQVALKHVVDIRTRCAVPNLYRGRTVPTARLRPRRSAVQWGDALRRRAARLGLASPPA
jgi:hypothetical protein